MDFQSACSGILNTVREYCFVRLLEYSESHNVENIYVEPKPCILLLQFILLCSIL